MNVNDFVVYKKGGTISSMNFPISNMFTDANLPAIISGGGNSKQKYGIPMGLALLSEPNIDLNKHNDITMIKEGGNIHKTLYDNLLEFHQKNTVKNTTNTANTVKNTKSGGEPKKTRKHKQKKLQKKLNKTKKKKKI
jgi:hypothetical protein